MASPLASCSFLASAAAGKKIVTIEGLAQNGVLHQVQKAWIEHDVPQCGYCQSGMIMAAAELLQNKPKPTDADIDREITNICRCGTWTGLARGDPRRRERVREGMIMNFIPKMNRRSFVVGAAAVGGGLSIGFELPTGPQIVRAADGSPEIGVWVVIRPDETVVIRTARSEMGQGSLTGLAQLIAEELECDWSKVTTEYVTPGQSVARKRAWGAFSSTGSRSIRESSWRSMRAGGGAAARPTLIQAYAANEQGSAGSPSAAHRTARSRTRPARRPPMARWSKPPLSSVCRRTPRFKDPKDWKIAGKGLKRLDTADKVVGKMEYGIDVKLPGMLNAWIKACPVFGGKVKSFDVPPPRPRRCRASKR